MSDFVLDWEREARTGVAEAVLCEPKTPAQIAAILETAATNGARLLLTRLAPAQHGATLMCRNAGVLTWTVPFTCSSCYPPNQQRQRPARR